MAFSSFQWCVCTLCTITCHFCHSFMFSKFCFNCLYACLLVNVLANGDCWRGITFFRARVQSLDPKRCQHYILLLFTRVHAVAGICEIIFYIIYFLVCTHVCLSVVLSHNVLLSHTGRYFEYIYHYMELIQYSEIVHYM